jgi:hypothetical protein
LFIAREMLDPHLKVAGAVLNSKLPMPQRMRAAAKASWFYARWYPLQWLPGSSYGSQNPALNRHLRYAAKTARRLARGIFHAMVRHGPKLEREQLLLFRFVNVGAEVFAITAACLRADRLLDGAGDGEVLRLADYFCRTARLRIEENFRHIARNADHAGYHLAHETLDGKLAEIERGIVE